MEYVQYKVCIVLFVDRINDEKHEMCLHWGLQRHSYE